MSGAAPLSKDLIHAVKKRLGAEVRQAYGLSETSPVCHMQVSIFPAATAFLHSLTEVETLGQRTRLKRTRTAKSNRQIYVPRRHRSARR